MSDNSTPEESRVEFYGPGPFDLPVAQAVHAEPQGEHVTLTLRVLVQGRDLAAVRITVLNNQALTLAAQMKAAAIEASGEDK